MHSKLIFVILAEEILMYMYVRRDVENIMKSAKYKKYKI